MFFSSRDTSTPYDAHTIRPSSLTIFQLTLFAIPALLFIPLLLYSLNTPFALVDDYGMCYYVEYLDSAKRFMNWLHKEVLAFSYGRYRPFFDLYNMVTWKLFGPSPWLHHLSRWILHFAAIFTFSAAFLCISRDNKKQIFPDLAENQRTSLILPLALLVYLWLYFPNSPASRLGPQEVYTVFFLGLCNWMMALILLQEKRERKVVPALLHYGLFYLGYLGLSLSKEINIAVMLWIVVFYYGLLLRGVNWRKILCGLPLIAIFLYTFSKIYIASKNSFYGVSPLTPDLLIENAKWIFTELFQLNTSRYITAGLLILASLLLVSMTCKLFKRRIDNELVFLLFLLGQFASLFLIVSTSWAPVLRYWYIIIPVFTTLLAFSARSILENARPRFTILFHRLALTGFLIFFIGCNYYNFSLQTIAQYSFRTAEAALIAEISRLHDQDQYIQILTTKGDPEAELVAHLTAYYRLFSPRFYDRKYKIYTEPPAVSGKPYYIVTMHEQPGNMDIHKTIASEHEYLLLSYAYRVARVFQGKDPQLSKDAGVHLLGDYRWIIYKTTT